MDWSSVFNIVGFSIIVFSLRKFAGDGFNDILRYGVIVVIGAIVLKNYQDVLGVIEHLSDQWWPILKKVTLSASDRFSGLVGRLIE